jgi:hypothetical protein
MAKGKTFMEEHPLPKTQGGSQVGSYNSNAYKSRLHPIQQRDDLIAKALMIDCEIGRTSLQRDRNPFKAGVIVKKLQVIIQNSSSKSTKEQAEAAIELLSEFNADLVLADHCRGKIYKEVTTPIVVQH